jgi:hypothetical protein
MNYEKTSRTALDLGGAIKAASSSNVCTVQVQNVGLVTESRYLAYSLIVLPHLQYTFTQG